MARQGAIGVEEIIRNKIGRLRYWKLTSLGKKRPKWGFKFKVMTYNILSQTAVDSHMYLYMKCNPQFLNEDYRISKILPEILKSRSDVVCLQEVEQWLYEQRIRQVFDSNGFGSIFKKRTGNKSDGCAILWRRSKFNLLRHQEVEFSAKECQFLNRDNVGLIAVLVPTHPQASYTQVHVATTHLIYNPRRGDVKFCQLRLLLAELERSAFKSVDKNGRIYHPIVLCGDFNSEPHSPLYEFIENGRLDVAGLLSGNLSGQYEGKNKGGMLSGSALSMYRLGIDESGRFVQDPDESGSEVTKPEGEIVVDKKTSGVGVSQRVTEATSNGSRLETDASHLQPKVVVDSSGNEQVANNEMGEFIKDAAPNLESEVPQIFYHDFNFVPTYKYYHQDSKNYPITCMTDRDRHTVDHIFYNVVQKSSATYVEDRLKLLGIYRLPHEEDLREVGGLPNAHLGSDHLNLMSEFLISFKH